MSSESWKNEMVEEIEEIVSEGLNSESWRNEMVEEIEEIASEGSKDDSDESVSDSSDSAQMDPLQFTVDEINKQIAIKNYLREKPDDQGLEIVEINNDTIRASSEGELDLAKGLLFNVFTNTGSSSTSERIATAELTESESTSGRVYEFEIREWKYDDDDEEIGSARNRIEENQGRMQIITEGIVEVDEAELETVREQILEMKNKRDMQYET